MVLDIRLTPALVEEGFVRELVSKIQTMRKEADFAVTDHIAVYYQGSDTIAGIFARYGDAIAADTLADQLHNAQPQGYSKDWDVNGEAVSLGVQKL